MTLAYGDGDTEKALAAVSNTPDGVTFKYAVTGLDEDAPTDDAAWSTTIPTKTDAGTYKIWYKAEGTENYEAVTATAFPTNAMIKKAAVEYTAPELTATSMTYHGTALELMKTAGTVTDQTHLRLARLLTLRIPARRMQSSSTRTF